MTIDLFYKTYRGDFPFLEHSLKSLKQRAKGFRNIIIVTDPGERNELIELIAPLKLSAIQVFELDSKLDIHSPTILPRPLRKLKRSFYKVIQSSKRIVKPSKIGYEIQKAVKCDWTQWSDADAVFQIDSDMLLTGDFDTQQLFHDDQPVWLRSDWAHCGKQQIKYWRRGSLWFFKLQDTRYSYMGSPGFLLTRELTQKFNEYVQAYFHCSTYRLFSDPKYPELSEYELLGLFAELNELDTPYYFEDESSASALGLRLPMKQFWSWGGFTEEVINEIQKLENPIDHPMATDETSWQRQ